MFKFWLLLGRCGFFVYEGLRGQHPRWWPEARVQYLDQILESVPPERTVSRPMAIGNAVQYAQMFQGKVVPVGARK